MHYPTDRITHTTAFVTPVMEHWLEREIAQWVHPMKDRSDDPSHHERTLYLWATSRSVIQYRTFLHYYPEVCQTIFENIIKNIINNVISMHQITGLAYDRFVSKVKLGSGQWDLASGSGTKLLHWAPTTSQWVMPSYRCIFEGRKEMFYLTTHSTHFILRLYGVGHMVKDHSDSERGNPLPPHRLLFLISSNSFICIIPQTG